MIDTIFYFVSDFDTYKQKLDNNEILAKTIVFVEDQKAIYKNGVRYGSMSDQDFYQKFILNYLNTYDDSWIRDYLDRINALITNEQNRLSDVIRDLDADILDKVEDLLKDSDWLRNNVNQNELFQQSMKWDDEIQAYLQEVGMWTEDEHGNTVTQWSKLLQKINDIEQLVGSTTEYPDGIIDALSSALNLHVDPQTHEATSEINSLYAELNKAKNVVEWMYSGLKTSASLNKTFAEIVSAGKNFLTGAIADMRASIETLKEGGYVSNSSLTSQIENYVNGQIATGGIINQAAENAATSIVTAKLSNPTDNIQGWSTLAATVDSINGSYVSTNSLTSAVNNAINNKMTDAGIVTRATIDEAVVHLFAENENSETKAAITAIAGEEASKVEITGDVIDARVNLLLVSGSGTFNGTVQAKLFIAGEDGKPGIVVQAGNFDPNGADTTKAYFAYDTRQHASSIFIYDPNESGGKWKSLSFANAFVADNYYPVTYALYEDTNNLGGIGSIPNNITSISASNFSTTSLYYSNLDRNTYVVENDPDPTNLAVGNYLKNTSIYKGVGAPANNYFMLYLGIHNNYFIVAAIQIEVFTTDYVTYTNSSNTTSITNVSGKDVIYSSDAVTNCTINNDGEITNVSRGGCFLKGIRKLSTRHQSGLTVTDSDIDVVDKGWNPSAADPDPVSNNNGRSLKTDVDECIGKVLMPNGDVYDITPYSTDRSLATGTQNSYWRTHGVDFVSNNNIILMFDKATDLGDSGYRNTTIGTSLTSVDDNTRRWGTRVAHYIDLSRFTQTAPSKDYLKHSSTDEGLWEDMTYLYTATAAA